MNNIVKKEFKGAELRHIEPYRLLKEGLNDHLDNFFLVLAVIYNDLKGIILFEKLITDGYRLPPIDEVSVHAGEYGGIFTQTRKILSGNIREFLGFLKENKSELSTTEFKSLLFKTSKDTQARWKDIIDVAFDKTTKDSEFTNYLIQIRNNVSFHYHQSDKALKNAFCNYFNIKEKIPRNEMAYYMIGENMEDTRFFYADAAVGEYLRSTTNDKQEGFDVKYKKEMDKMIFDMNFAIFKLLKVYLKNRPK